MADFTFTVPDNILDEVIDSFVSVYGYRDKIENPYFNPNVEGSKPLIDNPVGKKDFFMEKIISFVQDVSKSSFIEKAVVAERKKAKVEIDTRIVLSDKPTAGG